MYFCLPFYLFRQNNKLTVFYASSEKKLMRNKLEIMQGF